MGKTGEMPRAEAALVVGTNTSVAPLESALPQVDRIKLAQKQIGLVQKLLMVSSRWLEYLIFIDQVVGY